MVNTATTNVYGINWPDTLELTDKEIQEKITQLLWSTNWITTFRNLLTYAQGSNKPEEATRLLSLLLEDRDNSKQEIMELLQWTVANKLQSSTSKIEDISLQLEIAQVIISKQIWEILLLESRISTSRPLTQEKNRANQITAIPVQLWSIVDTSEKDAEIADLKEQLVLTKEKNVLLEEKNLELAEVNLIFWQDLQNSQKKLAKLWSEYNIISEKLGYIRQQLQIAEANNVTKIPRLLTDGLDTIA